LYSQTTKQGNTDTYIKSHHIISYRTFVVRLLQIGQSTVHSQQYSNIKT